MGSTCDSFRRNHPVGSDYFVDMIQQMSELATDVGETSVAALLAAVAEARKLELERCSMGEDLLVPLRILGSTSGYGVEIPEVPDMDFKKEG